MSAILTAILMLSDFGCLEPVPPHEVVYSEAPAPDGSLTGGRVLLHMPADSGTPARPRGDRPDRRRLVRLP